MNKFLNTAHRLSPSVLSEDLVLLIDFSWSMEEKDLKPTRLEATKKASAGLLDVKLQHHPKDRLAVAGFGSRGRVFHHLATVERAAKSLRRAINRVSAGGSTEMADGLREASVLLGTHSSLAGGVLRSLRRLIFEEPKAATGQALPVGKRIIMLSDGSNTGDEDPSETANALKERGVVIDTIGIGGEPWDVDEKMLKAIASTNRDGSKRYVFIKDTEQLIRKFEKLGNHLRKLEVS